MDSAKNFNRYIQDTIIKNWDFDAFTDYNGCTLQYHDVARKIEKLHILFESSGVKKGDKIGLCGRNSASWSAAFFAILTYGAVAVPIQHQFKSEQIYNVVNHSEAKLLFVGDIVNTSLDPEQMPNLEGIIYIPDYSLVISRTERLTDAREHLNEIYGRRYPKYFRKEHVNYHVDTPDELAIINYTSGTTGHSKGVMLTYRSLLSNLQWAKDEIGNMYEPNGNVISFLPLAHMYGMMLDLIAGFAMGQHISFLNRLPSPSLIIEACNKLHPSVIASVPLVVEKIVRKEIFPIIETNRMKIMLNMPIVGNKVKERVREMTINLFGGNVKELIIGGAGLNREIEAFLTSIKFPFTCGYGTTETGPMITFSRYDSYVTHSCGRPVVNMEVKIDSPDPANARGEVLTRGDNTLIGYFKDKEATDQALKDGWFHTGDLGTMDENGNLFLHGRIKNMILGPDGQNIYPEEIEDKLNSMALVSESLVVKRENKLIALVYPDYEYASKMGFNEDDLQKIMTENLQNVNEVLPHYCKLNGIRLQKTEFQKTPKKSIKRYLYQENC